jgi:hypothetical protein
MIIGKPRDYWNIGPTVFGVNGERIGVVLVSGLQNALEASRGSGILDIPDIAIRGADAASERFLSDWSPGTRMDLTIRDNKRDQWYRVENAWPRRNDAMSGTVTLVNECVREVDGPE